MLGQRGKFDFSHIQGWSCMVLIVRANIALLCMHMLKVWRCCRDVCEGACIEARGMEGTIE
jgi:hypothetical protein